MPKLADNALATIATNLASHNEAVKAELRTLAADLVSVADDLDKAAASLQAFNDPSIQRVKDVCFSIAQTVRGNMLSVTSTLEPPPAPILPPTQ